MAFRDVGLPLLVAQLVVEREGADEVVVDGSSGVAHQDRVLAQQEPGPRIVPVEGGGLLQALHGLGDLALRPPGRRRGRAGSPCRWGSARPARRSSSPPRPGRRAAAPGARAIRYCSRVSAGRRRPRRRSRRRPGPCRGSRGSRRSRSASRARPRSRGRPRPRARGRGPRRRSRRAASAPGLPGRPSPPPAKWSRAAGSPGSAGPPRAPGAAVRPGLPTMRKRPPSSTLSAPRWRVVRAPPGSTETRRRSTRTVVSRAADASRHEAVDLEELREPAQHALVVAAGGQLQVAQRPQDAQRVEDAQVRALGEARGDHLGHAGAGPGQGRVGGLVGQGQHGHGVPGGGRERRRRGGADRGRMGRPGRAARRSRPRAATTSAATSGSASARRGIRDEPASTPLAVQVGDELARASGSGARGCARGSAGSRAGRGAAPGRPSRRCRGRAR